MDKSEMLLVEEVPGGKKRKNPQESHVPMLHVWVVDGGSMIDTNKMRDCEQN